MSNSAVMGERVFWVFEEGGRIWNTAEDEDDGKGSTSGSGSVPVVLRPSRLVRGVPVLISVETDWFREMRVELAADWRAGIMAGPGKMWAFVRWAHVAMRRGPRVYCDCTVS